MINKKTLIWIMTIFLIMDVLIGLLFFLSKKVADRGQPDPPADPNIDMPIGKMITGGEPFEVKASDSRFEKSIGVGQLAYPSKNLPFEFLGCDEDLEAPFEDPYKFVEGLGFSREVLLPDQGDLQNLSVYLKFSQDQFPENSSLESMTLQTEQEEANKTEQNSSQKNILEKDTHEQNRYEQKQIVQEFHEQSVRTTTHQLDSDRDYRQGLTSNASNQNESNDETSLSKVGSTAGFPIKLDSTRPFIKLEFSQDISEIGKFRIRALTYSKENLHGSSQELELHPDSSVLLNKGEGLKAFKKEIFNLVRAGAQIGSRTAIISQEYQRAGATAFMSLEFLNGDISRLTASGINCISNGSVLSCRCTTQKEIP